MFIKQHAKDDIWFGMLNMPFTSFKSCMHKANASIEFWSSDLLSSLNFGPVTDGRTDRQTESDAYEPTVHKHRCAQKTQPTMKSKEIHLDFLYKINL